MLHSIFWYFRKLELMRNFLKSLNDAFSAIWNAALEAGAAKKTLKTISLNVAFFRNLKWCFWSWNCWDNLKFWLHLKRCKMRCRFIIVGCSGPDVIFKSLFCVVYYFKCWTLHTINNRTRESSSIVYMLK